jgi:hypothetical protein
MKAVTKNKTKANANGSNFDQKLNGMTVTQFVRKHTAEQIADAFEPEELLVLWARYVNECDERRKTAKKTLTIDIIGNKKICHRGTEAQS